MRPGGCSTSRHRRRSAARVTSAASLERAARGGRLTPADLLEVAETLEATARFEERLRSWRGAPPGRSARGARCAPELAARIDRSVDESGEILDSASSELATIRRRLRTSQDRVRERLNTMLRSTQLAGVIGEPIVTVRCRPLRDPDPGRGEGQASRGSCTTRAPRARRSSSSR